MQEKTFTEPHRRTLDKMYIPEDRMLLAVQLLLEGNSIRSTERITWLFSEPELCPPVHFRISGHLKQYVANQIHISFHDWTAYHGSEMRVCYPMEMERCHGCLSVQRTIKALPIGRTD